MVGAGMECVTRSSGGGGSPARRPPSLPPARRPPRPLLRQAGERRRKRRRAEVRSSCGGARGRGKRLPGPSGTGCRPRRRPAGAASRWSRKPAAGRGGAGGGTVVRATAATTPAKVDRAQARRQVRRRRGAACARAGTARWSPTRARTARRTPASGPSSSATTSSPPTATRTRTASPSRRSIPAGAAPRAARCGSPTITEKSPYKILQMMKRGFFFLPNGSSPSSHRILIPFLACSNDTASSPSL
ncbi:hypothetical protein PR202_ga04511 [Eleusine coracana subsp. coracana]|uniref:Uncharacterized protein n=1 Tax=Eleusine coracana subsp. coracana TaxID=191504 RepID=A0AAV5BRT3_ELECO|nr:hypothetical protein PR202_ga04511 [Eleusine coracana subsp. coracana]